MFPGTQKNGGLGTRPGYEATIESLVLRTLWYCNQVTSHTFTNDAMDIDVTIVVLALCMKRKTISLYSSHHKIF